MKRAIRQEKTKLFDRIAILGAGNIGTAMAKGFLRSGHLKAGEIVLTRHKINLLSDFLKEGFVVSSNNIAALERARVVIIAVDPHQLDNLLLEIGPKLQTQKHVVVSVVSGASIEEIAKQIPNDVAIIRAMPNIAVALGESMTCLAATPETDPQALRLITALFDTVGKTLLIDEAQMIPATALCACGIAFFLRAIRAASQGGIEIGFHSTEALTMAAQTAKGAASLLLHFGNHPEMEIDKVTTPRGCTIAGLNQMEHNGFGSAMIKGIVTSAQKAASLYAQAPVNK